MHELYLQYFCIYIIFKKGHFYANRRRKYRKIQAAPRIRTKNEIDKLMIYTDFYSAPALAWRKERNAYPALNPILFFGSSATVAVQTSGKIVN